MRLRLLPGLLVGLLVSTALTAQAHAAAHESRSLKPTDGTSTTTRTYSAFGDSIAAGYCGIFCRTDSFSVRHARDVANRFDATVSYRGRAVSGDLMSQIADEVSIYRSEVATADFIAIDGCGNDYLDARGSFRNQTTCAETVLATALDTCHTNLVRALNTIAANKKPTATVVVMNLYYPGVNADKSRTCSTGGTHFDVFLDYIVESNWIACTEALARGFDCADAFAGFNAADFDTDGDGLVDSNEIRFDPISDIDDFNNYYTRIVINNKHLIKDANLKQVSPTSTADYLQSDDTHPTAAGHTRIATECSNVTL
ncbi:MAG TPA: SGNH/GDSL hydrolase family protein [Haliangium sp.]|nr:SGNH/GDSL hydrolase family protein [Haliangium sp.]